MPPLRRSRRNFDTIQQSPNSRHATRSSRSSTRRGSQNHNQSQTQRTESSESSSRTLPFQRGRLSRPSVVQSESPLSVPSSLCNEPEDRPLIEDFVIPLHTVHLQYPFFEVGFWHSIDQCLLICALEILIGTTDGQHLTDDTVAMIMMYRYGDEEQSLSSGALYRYLMQDRWDQRNRTVRDIWHQLEEEHVEWARTAQLCYWQWMEYMKGIWRR